MFDKPSYEELAQRVKGLEEDAAKRNVPEQALVNASENLKTILARSPFGVVVIGKDRKIRWANEAVRKMAGVGSHLELLNKNCGVYLCPAQQTECPILDKGQTVDNSERIFRRKDGVEIPIIKTITEINMDGENVLLETFVDITERKQAEQEAIRASENLKTILAKSPFGVVVIGKDRKIRWANEAVRKMAGVGSHLELLNKNCGVYLCPAQQTECPILDKGQTVDNSERIFRRKDGVEIPIIKTITEINMDGENVLLETFVDITERKKAEQALRASEEKYRALSTELSLGLSDVFEALKQISAGDPEVRIPETSRLELIGKLKRTVNMTAENLAEIVNLSHEFAMGLAEHFDTLDRVSRGDLAARVMGKSEVELIESLKTVTNKMIESVAQEITERKRAEMVLQKSERELRHLSSRLLAAQEEERKRIALELHDSLGQSLCAIQCSLAASLEQTGEKEHSTGVKLLKRSISILEGVVEEVHRVSMDLRPSMLDDLGLLPTIESACAQFESVHSEIHLEKQIDIQEHDLLDPLKIVIYRVLQEALNNIAKHSHADLVRLYLRKTDGKIALVISDNGRGFDLEHVLSVKKSRRGLGLTSMKERAELSGGTFSIESSKGSGTTLLASWKD